MIQDPHQGRKNIKNLEVKKRKQVNIISIKELMKLMQ